jgi:hypothetical protein
MLSLFLLKKEIKLVDQQLVVISENIDINNLQVKSKNIFIRTKLTFKTTTEENKFIQLIVDQYDSNPRYNYV